MRDEQRIRVLIADDQQLARRGLIALLAIWPEVEIVGEASNGREAVLLAEQFCPDVVLMDVRMPVMDGIAATWFIKHQWPTMRVIVLTLYGNHRGDALGAGADAFLIKGCPTEKLVEAIFTRCMPTLHGQAGGSSNGNGDVSTNGTVLYTQERCKQTG